MTPQTDARKPGEVLFALLLLVFSISAFWQSYGISGFSGKTTPGVFPMLASGVMIVSGVVILLGALRKPAVARASAGFMAQILPTHHIVLIALVLGYVVLMPFFGFVVSSAVFLFCAFQYLWRKNPLVILALSAVTLVIVYIIFREVFQVVLPQGTLMRAWF
ncbi:MAG: tripartite tricarboxylate transporter TctB family protein [Sedimentitalea sp.]